MGKYELLYIVHPDLEASIDKITAHARQMIEGRKGKINYEENWGKRKLAYPIKKADVGIYVLWFFEAPHSAIAKIERDLRLTEEIIRYMILATPDKVKVAKPKKEKTGPKEEKAEAEAKGTEKTEEKVAAKTPVKKTAKKKVEAAPVENEKDRMKKLDEKLGALLGEEEDNKGK